MYSLDEIRRMNNKAVADYRKKSRTLEIKNPPKWGLPQGEKDYPPPSKWDAKTKIARFKFLSRWMIELFDGQVSPIPKRSLRSLIALLRVEVER
jgi:hypothetical protein